MIWTFLTLVSLVALGGFIAYYGDLQGRRWGKKKISKFGLRPKHTAILLTSITGAVISLFSILTLLTINVPLRNILLRGEAAIRDNKQLNSQILEQKLTLHHLQDQEHDAVSELNLTNQKAAELDANVRKLAKASSELKAERDKVQLELNEERRQVALSQQKVASLQAEQKKLQVVNKKVTQINKDYAKDNDRQLRENYELAKSNKTLNTGNAKLVEGNEKLLSVRDVLLDVNKKLLDANKAQTDEAAAQAATQQAYARTLQEQIDSLKQEYNQLSLQRQDIGRSYLALRQGKFSIRANAELARRTIDANMRPEAVRRELDELLNSASAAALVRGAILDGNNRAVRIVQKRVRSLAGIEDVDEQDSLNAVVDNLAGRSYPAVVVVRAVNNSVEGEPVLVELTSYIVNTIFEKGEKVASFQIHARQPTDKIFAALVEFLNKEVRDAAIKAGTIPQVDPETGLPRVGSIETSDLLKLTERIRKMGGDVIVTAVTDRQTTSADPLHLTFNLAHPPPEP